MLGRKPPLPLGHYRDKIKAKLGGLIDKFAGAAVKRLANYWPKGPGGAAAGNPDQDYKGLASRIASWDANKGGDKPHSRSGGTSRPTVPREAAAQVRQLKLRCNDMLSP